MAPHREPTGSSTVSDAPGLWAVAEEGADVAQQWRHALSRILVAERQGGSSQGHLAAQVIADAIGRRLLRPLADGVVIHEMQTAGHAPIRGVMTALDATLAGNGRLNVHERTLLLREQALASFQAACPVDLAPVLVAHEPSLALRALVDDITRTDLIATVVHNDTTHRFWWGPGDVHGAVDQLGSMTVMDGHHRVAVARQRSRRHGVAQPIFAELVEASQLSMAGFDLVVTVEDAATAIARIDQLGAVPVDEPSLQRPAGSEVLIRASRRWWRLKVPTAPSTTTSAQPSDDTGFEPGESLIGLWAREQVLAALLSIDDARDDPRVKEIPGTAPLNGEAIDQMLQAAHPREHSAGSTSEAVLLVVATPRVDEVMRAAKAGVVLPPKSTYVHPKPPPGVVIHRRIVSPQSAE